MCTYTTTVTAPHTHTHTRTQMHTRAHNATTTRSVRAKRSFINDFLAGYYRATAVGSNAVHTSSPEYVGTAARNRNSADLNARKSTHKRFKSFHTHAHRSEITSHTLLYHILYSGSEVGGDRRGFSPPTSRSAHNPFRFNIFPKSVFKRCLLKKK